MSKANLHRALLRGGYKVSQGLKEKAGLMTSVLRSVRDSWGMDNKLDQGQRVASHAPAKIFKLRQKSDNSDIIENLVGVLQRGGVIALPTDTLYGVACLAQSTEAVEKIYKMKGRDLSKPVAICVGEVHDVFQWGKFPNIPALHGNTTPNTGASSRRPVELLSELLPGPVTLVTERTPALNMDLNPETQLVGVRVPDHRFIRDLSNRLKEPLALTSANLTSARSPLCLDDFKDLHTTLDAIVDGGHLGGPENSRQGSTVVRIMQDAKNFKIIRPGCAYQATVDILQNRWGMKLAV